MTAPAPVRRRDTDFRDLFRALGDLVDQQHADAATQALDRRVRQAVQTRACHTIRRFETAATEHQHRHVVGCWPVPEHEARTMRRLRDDWLEARMQMKEWR